MASLTILGIALLLLLLLYRYILSPIFFSPLSKIPNAHFSSPILPLWIWSKRRNSTGVRTLLALHEKHGPVVRLGPNEISINSAEALRTVYIGGFEKTSWYLYNFVNYGTPNLVSMLQHKPHSVQKRMISNVYSKSYLHSSKDLQKASDRLIFDRFLPNMRRVHEQGGELDVLDFMQGVGMDFTSAYLFGLSNATNFINNSLYRRHWLREYQIFKTQLPSERAGCEIEKWCLAMCEAADRFIHSDEKAKEEERSSGNTTQPIVYVRLSHSLQQSAQSDLPTLKPTILTTASEMLDHLIAGHETSGITLSYAMFELSHRPHLQTRLRSELTLNPQIMYPVGDDDDSPESIANRHASLLPSPRSIDALPLLNNILQETLRLYAAAPAQQPRLTPVSQSAGRTTIDGYAHIPEGVTVSASAYALHRNEIVFPQPEKWFPERWDVGGEKREEMRRMFFAFGQGGRMCLGSHFAIQEMKLVLAAVYTNFTTEIVLAGGMEQNVDSFIAGPVGGKCVLKLKRV